MNKLFPELQMDIFTEGIAFLNQQFNDISFFVEDKGKENLYHVILSSLFPNIKLHNIYTLTGVKSVIIRAKRNLNNKKKVYIVDQDFSHILNKKENLCNLFYLKRYSIENYFLEKNAIIDYLIEEGPSKNVRKILEKEICIKKIEKESISIFMPLIQLYLIIQKNNFRIKNMKYNVEYFYNTNNFSFKPNNLTNYKDDILIKIKEVDSRKTINSMGLEFKTHLKEVYTYPGKYLLKYVYFKLKHTYKTNCEFENFVFRLAKNCTFSSLNNDIGLDIKRFTNIS